MLPRRGGGGVAAGLKRAQLSYSEKEQENKKLY